MILNREDAERFWGRVTKTDSCWVWTGSLNSDGYGQFHMQEGGRNVNRRAHRIAYSATFGTVSGPLDHLCRNRACVNPWHLEPVTNRENVLRGEGITARLARRDECANGHTYTPENTRMEGTTRRCRACSAANQRAYYARRTAS